jgi:hypothetical protein
MYAFFADYSAHKIARRMENNFLRFELNPSLKLLAVFWRIDFKATEYGRFDRLLFLFYAINKDKVRLREGAYTTQQKKML